MLYTTFGRRTGLRVSEIALGTANFGAGCGASEAAARLVWGRRGDGAPDTEARAMFDRFAGAGGTLIDCADCYQFGEAERLVGDFIAADRDHFVLTTKFTNGVSPQPRISSTGNSRKAMVRSLEASLRRLRTDYLDVYWAHFPDNVTPVEEIVTAFDDLVSAGKILHAGLSNFSAWRVSRAVTLSELRRLSSSVIAVQTEYSLLSRTAEREILPMCEGLGLAAALWSPLAGGLLTGRYRRTAEGWITDGNRRIIRTSNTDRAAQVIDTVLEIAAETEATAGQVATAWVRARAQQSATALVPIVGPRTVAQLEEYLAALDLELTADQLDRLNRISEVELGVPHELGAVVRDAVLGGDAGRMRPARTPMA